MVITGEVIKKIRTKLDLTQDELATALDLSRELINKMETETLPISKSSKIIIRKFMEEKNLTSESLSQNGYSEVPDNTNELEDEGKLLENLLNEKGQKKIDVLATLTTIIQDQLKLLKEQHATIHMTIHEKEVTMQMLIKQMDSSIKENKAAKNVSG